MSATCPQCDSDSGISAARSNIVRYGSYFRTSDGQRIQRYRCLCCRKNFSAATFQAAYRQKKRHMNHTIRWLYCSNNSLRRIAFGLKLHRATVVRKTIFLALHAEKRLHRANLAAPPATHIEFDDLETFEHTKYKPLSVTLAVEYKTRRILGIEVSSMRAKGLLARRAKKYGDRRDTRRAARRRLFETIKPLVTHGCLIKSDMNPYYEPDVREFFPSAKYAQFRGRKGSLGGQGELKKGRFDPLFSLNHTCAMLRANVNRLIRKTWNTTKSANRLHRHLILYAEFHNSELLA